MSLIPTTEDIEDAYSFTYRNCHNEVGREAFRSWYAKEIAAKQAEALKNFAESIDLDAIAEEWQGPDESGHWSASNAASTVQMSAWAEAERLQKKGNPDE